MTPAKLTRRLPVILLLLLPLAALTAADGPEQKPNIVLIMADDLGTARPAAAAARR
jgi:hypothetical protein